MAPRWEYLDQPGVKAFAHRGGAAHHPENTMAAFEHAVDLGYTYLETDVRTTADGVLVAFHDETLDRMTDHRGPIAELTWAQLERASVGGHRIPRFDELLSAWPHARLNIDPKCDEAVLPLVRALRQHQAVGRVCIGSFSDSRIRTCQRLLGPELCTSMGPAMLARFRAASFGLPLGPVAEACAQLPSHLGPVPIADRRLLAYAADRGIEIHIWTVNDRRRMQRLLDLGVNGVISDETVMLKEILTAQGRWHDSPPKTR